MSGITDPTNPFFKDGGWGWDGTQWRKLSLLWGYSDRFVEQKSNLTAGAGQNDLDSTAVPAGYVYVLQAASMFNVNSQSDHEISVTDGSVVARIVKKTSVAAAATTTMPYAGIILKEGDKVKCRFTLCTANDDLYCQVWGYIMEIGA